MATLVKYARMYEADQGDRDGETWKYIVKFTDVDYTMRDARAAIQIPDGSSLAGTPWTSRSTATRDEEVPTVAYVTVQWSTPEVNRRAEKPAGADVKWNLKVSSRPTAYDRPVYQDGSGNAIVNAAGFPFQQQPTMTDYDSSFTVEFNTDSGAILNLLRDSIGRKNSDAVTLTYRGVQLEFAAGTLKLTDYSFAFDYYSDDGQPAFAVMIQLDERKDGWHDVSCENSGFYNAAGDRIYTSDINASADPDEPVVEAVLLDGSGNPLADGGTAVPLTFDVKAPVAFGPLLAGL